MRKSTLVPTLLLAATLWSTNARGAVALSALDQFVVAHGYAGAQFVQYQNTYRLPVSIDGKAGDLTIDTGAPTSVIFRATMAKFGLTQKDTNLMVHGAFGTGTEKIGITTLHQLTMGNCTLMNVKAAVVSDPGSGGLYRPYGTSDGLFGLRELIRYGAFLDLANHLVLVHPGGPTEGVSAGARSLLVARGYTPISLAVVAGHLRVAAIVNGTACQLIVDTGAFLTTFDQQLAGRAHLGGFETGQYAHGFGAKARPIRVSQFPEFRIGDFMIRNASVTITDLDPDLLGGAGKPGASGLLGAEYLGVHGAIFDLNSKTLYLRPKAKQ